MKVSQFIESRLSNTQCICSSRLKTLLEVPIGVLMISVRSIHRCSASSYQLQLIAIEKYCRCLHLLKHEVGSSESMSKSATAVSFSIAVNS